MIGSALCERLRRSGHEVAGLLRPRGRVPERVCKIGWLPETGSLDLDALKEWGGAEAVVHLAGENIAGRWTSKKKQRIRESRVAATRLFCESLLRIQTPLVFLSASAVGIYGNRGEEILTEESAPGQGFLAGVALEWEKACDPMRQGGVRVVNFRLGVVLSRTGGALAKMLPAFRLGLGGKIGSGAQWMSWISLEDVLGIILESLENLSLAGPVNTVSPQPVRNQEFTATLARILGRPAVIPIPRWPLRLIFADMADETLLTSQRAVPGKLESLYRFRYSTLESALEETLS
jgi:uncharacterized protein (TIGR01777 family)